MTQVVEAEIVDLGGAESRRKALFSPAQVTRLPSPLGNTRAEAFRERGRLPMKARTVDVIGIYRASPFLERDGQNEPSRPCRTARPPSKSAFAPSHSSGFVNHIAKKVSVWSRLTGRAGTLKAMSLCLLLGEALGADQGAVEVSVLAGPTNPPVASLVCFAGHLPLLSAPVGSPPERAVLRLLPASKF
jgi:hypothetical protein